MQVRWSWLGSPDRNSSHPLRRTLEERKGMLIDMAQELVAAINKARGRGASSPPKSNGDHAGDAFVTQDDVGEAM